MQPFAHVLHVDVVQRLAGSGVYERGKAYFREGRVSGIAQNGNALLGNVRGGGLYQVRIWVSGDRIAYSCPCPFAQEAFCKHAAALALAWLGSKVEPSDTEMESLRARLEQTELVELRSRLLAEARTNLELRCLLGRLFP